MKKTKKIMDVMTGEKNKYEQTYSKLYGKNDHSNEIDIMKRVILKKYFYVICAVFILTCAVAIFEGVHSARGVGFHGGKEISIQRPEEGENPLRIPMKLEAVAEDDKILTKNVLILIRPEDKTENIDIEEMKISQESVISRAETELRKLIKTINKSSDGKSITLPAELSGGIKLNWNESQSSRLPVLISIFPAAIFIIYQGRYTRIKKMEKEAEDSIIRELPEFMNKLVLLLNAGLVLTSAFARITETYENSGKEVKSYFYLQLLQIGRNMRETNSPMIHGLKDFAARSGVRELMRITNIISDNMDKGSELVYKLQEEGEVLWLTKRKRAEEKGRLAETKMTFPLVILLLVLIMITIAPALMEM